MKGGEVKFPQCVKLELKIKVLAHAHQNKDIAVKKFVEISFLGLNLHVGQHPKQPDCLCFMEMRLPVWEL